MFGLSYLLTLMNGAAINASVKVLFGQMCLLPLLGICLGVKYLDSIVILYLTFCKAAKLFFKVTAPFHILPGCADGFCCFPPSTPFIVVVFLIIAS